MSPDCALCCAGPRAAASDDAGREQRDGSIFSREGEKVFSHLADTASKRERLHRFCSGIERVLPQAAGRLAAHAETGGRAAAPRGEAVAAGAAARARKAARQRFARRISSVLTREMHSVRIGRGRRISTTPGCRRTLTGRLHSVSSVVGGWIIHNAIGPPIQRIEALTIQIHRAASRCGGRISTPACPLPADAAATLTGPMHRIASRLSGGDCPQRCAARDALFTAGAAGAEACECGAPRAQPHTKNPVSFDGEQRHASG